MAFSPGNLGRSPTVEPIGRAEQRTAIERRTRFVRAARELATETGSSAFTVHQVVSRSGLSLKSFYALFAGKDDLLVALLEEDIALGALALSEFVDSQREPRERLRAWVVGLFSLMAAGQHGHVAVLVREHRRLAETRPEAMAKALRPLLDLLVDELSAASRSQAISHRDPQRDARFVLDLVLAEIHDLVLHSHRPPERQQIDEVANYVWGFCWGGLRGAENADAVPKGRAGTPVSPPRERKQ